MTVKKTRVLAAMSGGVDSSVTAALLLEQGYEVIGATMQIWDPGREEVAGEHVGCCSLTAVNDARRVADRLSIPYYVLNFRRIFEEKVINYFTAEYLRGRTPNPCIACNRFVKFEALMDKAFALGADYVATGHYARLGYSDIYKRYIVRRSADRKKDQTYVLYGLTQQQIAHTLMPLGNFTKAEVRRKAAELGLLVADKAESQEICFIADDNYGRFLEEKTGGVKPGPFLDLAGKVIGQHRGIPFYTVGQRRGTGIAAGERLYVIKIDPVENTITLGPEEAIYGTELIAKDVNMILFEELRKPARVEAQIRYNARPSTALVAHLEDGTVHVRFREPQRSITPGQAVVFYQGEYLAGGGTIESVL